MQSREAQIDLFKKSLEVRVVESPIVKPGLINFNNEEWTVSRTLRRIKRILIKKLKENPEYINSHEDPFINSENLNVGLVPITDFERYFRGKTMVHFGTIPIEQYGNAGLKPIDQIRESGVFGDFNEKKPTYLMPPEENIQPGVNTTYELAHGSRNRVFIKLVVNLKKLAQLRDVYHDPEMFIFDPDMPNEEPGKAFLIFGGIPVECIQAVEVVDQK